jgi:hypothetical protein
VPPNIRTPRPALVVGRNPNICEPLLAALHRLAYVAVTLDACGSALEMLGVVEFALVFVVIEQASDWASCRRILGGARCPVTVVTPLRSPDRRYRLRAFRLGAAACMCPSGSPARIRALLDRIDNGDRCIDFTSEG